MPRFFLFQYKRNQASSNCSKNFKSFSKNSLRSLMPYFSMAMRSTPMPKAKPVYFSGSMPLAMRMLGSHMPQPRISTQPVCLQMLQPLPPQMLHEMSISAEVSVKGKYEGRKRTLVPSPKNSCTKWYKVCFKSAKETPSSM